MSKPKKAKPEKESAAPGTRMAAKIRARANKLTDPERESLMADAMRLIYAMEAGEARVHRR